MHTRPAVREELADRCLLPERREELDTAFADPDRCGLDAL
jgi:hypothetical protein